MVSILILILVYSDSQDPLLTGLIVTQTAFLVGYSEYLFKTPWPRLILPVSMASITYLAARMFFGTVPDPMFVWVVMIYGIASFILYHAVARMLTIYLWERRGRFTAIYDDVYIDMILFLVDASTLTFILVLNHAIRLYYAAGLIFVMYTTWFLTPLIVRYSILPVLLSRGPSIERPGYSHPVEPEVEKLHFSLSTMIVLASLAIPLLFAYTSPVLIRRAFVPMVLLWIYELMVSALFITAYMIIIHGAVMEAYAGNRMLRIEDYRVFNAWRDIAWYYNRNLGYYLKMKYLSALYMLLQGLEILSIRIGDKELYYGPIHELLEEGLNTLKSNREASKYVLWSIVNETMKSLDPEKLYIVEGNWKPIEGTGFEDQVRKALGSIVNLYCKLHEVPREARAEAREMLKHARDKLENLYKKARRTVKPYVEELIGKIDFLLTKETVEPEELVKIGLIIRQPLTVNMLRNYFVHGQLFKNALVYENNRVKADRLMEKPGTLYTLYLLLLFASLHRAPQLLPEK